MMKKKFNYLANTLVQYAATAVIDYSFCKNSRAVHNCYYHYYNPVRGYTILYHHRTISAVLLQGNMPCYSTILFQR